jgi:hypothetical protein
MFSDPGRPACSRPLQNCRIALPHGTRKAPPINGLSRLSSMAFGLAVYVSRCWSPVTAQDWLPAAGQALPGGLLPAELLQKVFNSLHVPVPLLQACLAQSVSPCFIPFRKHPTASPFPDQEIRSTGQFFLEIGPRLLLDCSQRIAACRPPSPAGSQWVKKTERSEGPVQPVPFRPYTSPRLRTVQSPCAAALPHTGTRIWRRPNGGPGLVGNP